MTRKLASTAAAAWCLLALAGAFPATQAATTTELQNSVDPAPTAEALAQSVLAPYRVSPTPPWEQRDEKPARA